MSSFEQWLPRLVALCDDLRRRTRAALLAAECEGSGELARPRGQGKGDVTFGLDLPSEERISAWIEEQARSGALSLLTEDAGWRHRAPGARPAEVATPPGFVHGGPRIAIDPVDGTRNLMADLRSAWTALAFAPPGSGEPRLSDCTGAIVSEIPGTLAGRYRRLVSDGTTCWLELRELEGDHLLERRALRADSDDRPDHGYFPFFRYEPSQRPALATLEAAFFARLQREEGADMRAIYDDQYISSAGQLVLLALGRYRLVVDARAHLRGLPGLMGITSKPYDLAAAVVCARAAGVVVTAVDGGPLDFPIDATTPVGFVGYANEATRRRLEPHWLATLESQHPRI